MSTSTSPEAIINLWCSMGAGCVEAHRTAASSDWVATAKGRHPVSGEFFSVTVMGPFHVLLELLVEESPQLTSLLTDPQFSALLGRGPGGRMGEGGRPFTPALLGETICPGSCPGCGGLTPYSGGAIYGRVACSLCGGPR